MYLLLGIKNTLLDPVLIKILPSGVGVCLSQFTDIYGSRIIFAGTHKVFTKGYYKGDSQFRHGIFDTMEEYKEEMTWSTDVTYSKTVDRQTGYRNLPNSHYQS